MIGVVVGRRAHQLNDLRQRRRRAALTFPEGSRHDPLADVEVERGLVKRKLGRLEFGECLLIATLGIEMFASLKVSLSQHQVDFIGIRARCHRDEQSARAENLHALRFAKY